MLEALAARFGECGSLASALRVGLAQVPSWQVVEVVVQDEFTHDVIFTASASEAAIVLDCT